MQKLELIIRPAVIATALAIAATGIAAASAEEAGSCGEYKYWHDGKCVDARDKPAATWSDSMAKRPAW
jgi:hypothetical protein